MIESINMLIQKIFKYVSWRVSRKVSRILQIASLEKKFYKNQTVLDQFFSEMRINGSSVALDIGSGPKPRNPFNASVIRGADLRENITNGVVFADLATGILPFESNTFDFVTAHDVLEHIQRVAIVDGETRFPFISLMNEIFRVLKPGAIFFNIQPCYPSKQVFQDPTHVNIMSEDTIYNYFCEPAWARMYGYDGSFEMLKDGWLEYKYFSFFKKSANYPIRDVMIIPK